MTPDPQSSTGVAFTSLDGMRSKLDTFFTKPGMRILMIKGAWGTGKSYFVRNYITQIISCRARSGILPKWIAYASAFGCNSVQQLEERISESLQPKSLWNKVGASGFIPTIRKIFYALLIRLIGNSFVSPVSSIVWHFTRSREVLVVIDDLERSHNDLQIKDILGFVSSLAENSCENLKVILICNTEKLIQSNANDLSILREKVIHSELVFNPSPKELVTKFFGHEKQSSTMLECLSIIGEGNIRIVSRVSISLTEIVRLFEPTGVTLSDHDKNEIVRLCVFYFRADEAIGADWFQMHQKKQFEAISSPTKKQHVNLLMS